MKFHYKKYSNNILRPIIPIVLKNKNLKIGYEVLIDSRADICIFNAEIGEILGLEIEKGKIQEMFGIGGKSSFYYLHKITIEVGGWPYEIEAGFMPNVSGKITRYGVVGQKGFFDKFITTFNFKKGLIEIKPI